MDINPCGQCREQPEDGYYPGDFAIECPNCLTSISRHMVDFHGDFEEQADKAKENAITAWNQLNRKG